VGVREVLPIESFRVAKDGRGFLERDAVLGEIADGFPGVPGKLISVYT
jgi:hypothetical protein